MTDTINGQISAFIDDELMTEESELLVRRLCNDEELRQTAARYTLIGDAIRGSLQEIEADLNGTIMNAIEREPQPEVEAVEAQRAQGGLDWRRLAGGGAVAAAVAVMAVLTFRTDVPTSTPLSVSTEAMDAQAILAEQGEVVPSNDEASGLGVLPAPGLQRASTTSQLSNYVLLHNQYSQRTMRQGPLVYRTVTGQTPARTRAPQADGATTLQRDPSAPPTGTPAPKR
ncbi:MAG: sigma-E factor negative regulatory protein [Pseudomonadota bacterium]